MSPPLHRLAFAVCALLPVSASATTASPTQDTRPNIIFILCDDLGYGDLAVNGHPYVKSPNIDRLAAEGLTIQNAYMSSAWCAPSRYALMSGRYPAHYFQKSLSMDAEAPNLYQLLKSVGYTTAHFGKWHMSGKGAELQLLQRMESMKTLSTTVKSKVGAKKSVINHTGARIRLSATSI